MFLKLFLFIFSAPLLFSLSLQDRYEISSLDFNASHIDPSVSTDFIIYSFEPNKHQKSFTSSKLLKRLQKRGLLIEDGSKGIVHLKRQSSFDYTSIKNKIKKYYQSHYTHIDIQSIHLKNNGFIESLEDGFELVFKKKAYLYSRSNIHINAKKLKKRHFISYEIKAKLKVFKASHNLNRGRILSPLDLSYKEEDFKRFSTLPLQSKLNGQFRLKKRLASGKILYLNDIERLPAVLKGKSVNVRYISGQVHLEFQATSMQDGHIGELISIKKRDGKRLKAKVISRNFVEIQ